MRERVRVCTAARRTLNRLNSYLCNRNESSAWPGMSAWRAMSASGGGWRKGCFSSSFPTSTSASPPSSRCGPASIAWFFSIAGSAIAVVVIYLLAAMLGLDYLSFLDWIPGISEPLIHRVGQQLAAEGLPYTPLLVMAGVPLKLYVAQAFSLELSLGSVLLWTVFARIVRIAPTFAIVAAMRLLLGRRIDARAGAWCALLGIFWLAFYVFYFVHMSRA